LDPPSGKPEPQRLNQPEVRRFVSPVTWGKKKKKSENIRRRNARPPSPLHINKAGTRSTRRKTIRSREGNKNPYKGAADRRKANELRRMRENALQNKSCAVQQLFKNSFSRLKTGAFLLKSTRQQCCVGKGGGGGGSGGRSVPGNRDGNLKVIG